jgi:death-on-curing protein
MTGRQEPTWIDLDIALAIHDRQLSEHGGGAGVRDAGALESALARPLNRWAYGDDDRCALAAVYAFGLARNHPFVDGNKRTAWVLARLFLRLNDVAITFAPDDALATVIPLAAGVLTEDGLAHWLRAHSAAA